MFWIIIFLFLLVLCGSLNLIYIPKLVFGEISFWEYWHYSALTLIEDSKCESRKCALPSFGTQPRYEASGDLQVELDKKRSD